MKDKNGNVILCDYGCNHEALFTLSNGKYCCCDNWRKCSAIREKNRNGVNKAYSEGRLNRKLNYQNLSDDIKRRMAWSKGKSLLDIETVEKSRYVSGEGIKRLITNGIIDLEYKCCVCGNNGVWLDKPISLELHHINGDHHDNHISNLTFLCPNCHSQTDNFRARNKKCSGKYRIAKKELLEHLDSDFGGDIEKFIDHYKFNNTSKVYKEYLKLIHEGLLTIHQKEN